MAYWSGKRVWEVEKAYPRYDREMLCENLNTALQTLNCTVVVLDDDPTGTQTVQGLPVVTGWETELLRQELVQKPRMLFILTNSRALSAGESETLHTELAEHLWLAAQEAHREFLLVSRGDSTLRGHFPLETETLRKTLEGKNGAAFDGEILCPFFPEGGRYTICDVHYLIEADCLLPVGESEFARDKTFGFRSSHLGAWVEEKTSGAYPASGVVSISLEELRGGKTAEILEKLMRASGFQKIIVNAISYDDLAAFLPPLMQAIQAGKHYLFRTAAAFLKVLSGCMGNTVLEKSALVDVRNKNGGIVVVGSHVTTTTRQLEMLKRDGHLEFLELNQHLILDRPAFESEIHRVSKRASQLIAQGKSVVVATRRERLDLGGEDKEAELRLASQISAGIVAVIAGLQVRPRFVMAKGGITSSDVATMGLRIRRAEVLGQILPGIPVWRAGRESKFPNLPYVIFPGNVGADDALLAAVQKLQADETENEES